MAKKWSSRLTFFAFVVLMVGLGSNDSLRGIFSTIFQEHFSLTTTQLGLIVTASYIGNLVFLLVGGNLSTRFSKKRVLQVLILIWMAALALFAFTSNYTVLLIGMALALGSSTLLNTTMNLITPLLFATAPGFFVNFLFFTQEIGTSGSQYILGSHADGFSFWQHTNLVLLILGARLRFDAVQGLWKKILAAVSMRLVVVPLIVLTLVLLLREPLGLTTVEMPTIVAIFCSPVAVTSAVMVQEIGGDEQLAQQVVAWSSVLSMGTIFCFAAALRAMGVM